MYIARARERGPGRPSRGGGLGLAFVRRARPGRERGFDGNGKGNGMILLVDDDRRNADLFVEAMRLHGLDHEVVVARDGVECLGLLFGADHHGGQDLRVAPSLVLLDLHMPRMGGLETLHRIREDGRTKRLPVVMFSATAFPEDVTDAYRLGANAFVDKLSTPFPEAVRQIVRFWVRVNRTAPLVG